MITKADGKVVNQAEIARIFGTSTVTVRKWERNGCPSIEKSGRGREAKYSTSAVSNWLIKRAVEAVAISRPVVAAELHVNVAAVDKNLVCAIDEHVHSLEAPVAK